jgi:ParB-like chromosome segregation protein Spo0J
VLKVRSHEIELRKLSSIKPHPQNPRRNDDAVATSIREYGFRQSIVLDTAGVIIAGDTRWKAVHKLGLDKVRVHVAGYRAAAGDG